MREPERGCRRCAISIFRIRAREAAVAFVPVAVHVKLHAHRSAVQQCSRQPAHLFGSTILYFFILGACQ